MMKLYKYRPLSEFLYKELYYQELYFASYSELNDPLDLSARIDFTAKEKNQIENLLWFIYKTTLKVGESPISESSSFNNTQLILFTRNENLKDTYKTNVFNQLSVEKDFISIEDLENILNSISQTLPFKIDFSALKDELRRLTKKFLENSYTTCFSEINNDFLMWSHYASKHSGICLEFTSENEGLFPYKMTGKRGLNHEEYLKRISIWDTQETIFWERIRKVKYQKAQPYINFFDFFPVFDNEHDCDLIGLSKSWTHKFAFELEHIFSTKTLPWQYENEWRAIQINFGEVREPEDRISHYPIECLSAIYFGIRTPESAKKRIYKILNQQKNEVNYFNCVAASGRELAFEEWEYYEE